MSKPVSLTQTTSILETRTPSLIFFDLDGTLVNSKHQVGIEDRECLLDLSRRGFKTSFATGRPLFACSDLAAELEINSISVFFSGALICTPDLKQTLLELSIDRAVVLEFVQAAIEAGLYVELYTRQNYFCFRRSNLTELHALYLLRAAQLITTADIDSLDPILKMVVICPDAQQLESSICLVAQFPDLVNATGIGAAHREIAFANISASSASRAKCFEQICAHYQISANDVMAFGDGEADIPFLELAHTGVAMGNASEHVKAHANFVTKDVDHSGVSFALKRLLC